ncbi:MAG: hypothetical protein IJZ68_07815 [Bacteroidaceae bacterium]|nr:hypothetical protein [Bacteroidaceae bacterium]
MLKERFLSVYTVVFDEQGYVKNCGRHACMELINLANQIAPGVDHGNAETGIMNVQSMRDLHEKLSH